MSGPGATLRGLQEFAAAEGLALHLLAAADGTAVVVPAWGGRVIFLGPGDQNALWTNPDFKLAGQWGWNKGGARSWYSPEGGAKGVYFSADWSDWQCPPAIDPGDYRVLPGADSKHIALENEFKITTNDGSEYHLRLSRSVAVGAAPAVAGGVKSVPLTFSHGYKNLSPRTIHQEIDLWHIVQVNPAGTVLAPLRPGRDAPYRDYFEPVPGARVAVQGGCLSVHLDGAKRYKLGLAAESTTGKIAYFRPQGDQASMIVKRFTVAADGVYADRPQTEPDANGDPVQLYNHFSGGPEGFGEIECHGPAATLAPGETQDFTIEIVLLEGPREEVLAAGGRLLGVDTSAVKLFS